MVQALKEIWREAWQPPDRRPPWAWCEDHVEGIPYSPKSFNLNLSAPGVTDALIKRLS